MLSFLLLASKVMVMLLSVVVRGTTSAVEFPSLGFPSEHYRSTYEVLRVLAGTRFNVDGNNETWFHNPLALLDSRSFGFSLDERAFCQLFIETNSSFTTYMVILQIVSLHKLD